MAVRAESLDAERLSAPNRPLSQSIVAGVAGIIDFAIPIALGMLAYWVYVAPQVAGKVGFYWSATTLFSAVLLQSLHSAGLYRFSAIMAPGRNVGRQVGVYVLLFLVFLGFGFALKISHEYSRVWAFSWLLSTISVSVVARFGIAALVRRAAAAGHIRRNIVVYGGGTQGERLIQHIERLGEPWNEVVGVFDDRLSRLKEKVAGRPVLGNLNDLVAWSRQHRADEVLIALPWSAEERLLSIMHCLAVLPTNVRLSPEFVGMDRLHRRTSHQFDVPMLNVMEKPLSSWGAVMKDVMDRLLGMVLVLLCLPVLLLVAAAIRLESPGPVLFRQQRYGFNQQLITIYKFRTMYVQDTDHHADQLTRKGDPRVTRVGALIRRLSIDELPQLLNVLSGEMSLVGPRPHALKAKAGGKLYENVVDEYARRHKVKPGITGWAQVNGWRGNTETEQDLIGRVEHDLYYIENWSLLFDLSIILRTVWVCLRGTNSY